MRRLVWLLIRAAAIAVAAAVVFPDSPVRSAVLSLSLLVAFLISDDWGSPR